MKAGVIRRAAVLAAVVFGGCTVENHRECLEYPTIHGPCSWAHSAWQSVGVFGFSVVSMSVMLLAGLWVSGIVWFGKGSNR